MLDPERWTKLVANPSKKAHLRANFGKLVQRFTGGGEFPSWLLKTFSTKRLKQADLKCLQNLCNSIGKSIKEKTGSRELDHMYTNILACLVCDDDSSEKRNTYSSFKDSGWDFGSRRYQTARKRKREETYTKMVPAKRGRGSISADLISKIEAEWIKNSRPGANLIVTEPKTRIKRPGLRLMTPAIHIVLKSPLVRTEARPDGEVSITTFKKYRP